MLDPSYKLKFYKAIIQLKKQKLSDANDLKAFSDLSQASFNDSFSEGGSKEEDNIGVGGTQVGGSTGSGSAGLAAAGTEEDQAAKQKLEGCGGRGKRVEIASAAPDEYEAQLDAVTKLQTGMEEAKKNGPHPAGCRALQGKQLEPSWAGVPSQCQSASSMCTDIPLR